MLYDIEFLKLLYNSGKSINAIAKEAGMYPMTVQRLLEKNGVEMRHDRCQKGVTTLNDGDKLIEWAKAQGRLVTKTELAHVLGKTKLSSSYFTKYPELSKYIKTAPQQELRDYYTALYNWLNENNIPYKPRDKKRTGIMLDALLLNEYKDIALCICEKPQMLSNIRYANKMDAICKKTSLAGVALILVTAEDLKDPTELKAYIERCKTMRQTYGS